MTKLVVSIQGIFKDGIHLFLILTSHTLSSFRVEKIETLSDCLRSPMEEILGPSDSMTLHLSVILCQHCSSFFHFFSYPLSNKNYYKTHLYTVPTDMPGGTSERYNYPRNDVHIFFLIIFHRVTKENFF